LVNINKIVNCRTCGVEFMQSRYWQTSCSKTHHQIYYNAAQELGISLINDGKYINELRAIIDRMIKKDRPPSKSHEQRKLEKAEKKEQKRRDKLSPIEQLKEKETWREWIRRDCKTETTRKRFIEENMIQKELFISLDQYIGESNDEFRLRSEDKTTGN